VEQDDAFPADMVLLQSALGQGVCNIETANLDGETNLKQKKARPATYNIECAADGEDYPNKFRGVLESDAPCENMDSAGWKGNFYQLPGHDEAVPLSMEQLLLRVCNTYIYIYLHVYICVLTLTQGMQFPC
jgi:magnesium-transporting ATPase (P-type)